MPSSGELRIESIVLKLDAECRNQRFMHQKNVRKHPLLVVTAVDGKNRIAYSANTIMKTDSSNANELLQATVDTISFRFSSSWLLCISCLDGISEAFSLSDFDNMKQIVLKDGITIENANTCQQFIPAFFYFSGSW